MKEGRGKGGEGEMEEEGRKGTEGTAIKEGEGGGRFAARGWKGEGRDENKGRRGRGWGPHRGKGVGRKRWE